MAKGAAQSQKLPADVLNLVEQLERHCLAPDGSYLSKSAHSDLQQAREEMSRERTRYLEATAVYAVAIAMVEEYQQAVSSANLGGVRDQHSLYSHGLSCSPKVTRLREYQGVDAHFDTIARQYHGIVKKLEGMQWTIHQVEMDLKRSLEHPAS